MLTLGFEVVRCANCRDNAWKDNNQVAVGATKIKGRWNIDEGRGYVTYHKPACGQDSKVSYREENLIPSTTGQTDLSDTYGIVGDTLFNKKTKVVFVTPEEFFADSGKSSFDGLTYDRMSSLPLGLQFVNGRKLTEVDYRRIQGR